MRNLRNQRGQFLAAMVLVYGLAFLLLLLLLKGSGREQSAEQEQALAQTDMLAPIPKTAAERPRQGQLFIYKRSGELARLPWEITGKGLSKNEYLTYARDYPYLLAPGIDAKYRPAPTYFVHFEPYKTDKIWMPLVTLSNRLKYQSDFHLFDWRSDVWQTSRYAYRTRKGDCEDHALLLADWWTQMGYDARVVIGKWNFDAHAWVVLFKDGNEYLFESTKKDLPPKFKPVINKYAYQPLAMFNKDSYWLNTGNIGTISYSSSAWERLGEFREY